MPVATLPPPSPNFSLTVLEGSKLYCDTDFLTNKAHRDDVHPGIEAYGKTEARQKDCHISSCFTLPPISTLQHNPPPPLAKSVGDKPAEGDG